VNVENFPKPAIDLATYLELIIGDYKRQIKPTESYRILLGNFRIQQIHTLGHEFILFRVLDGNGAESEIITHASHVILRFEIFSPATDAERKEKIVEKVLYGFGPEEVQSPSNTLT